MKKSIAFAVLALGFGFSAHADYNIPGGAWIKYSTNGTMNWTCDNPGNGCYSHTGPSQAPTPGDKVTVHDPVLGDKEAVLASAVQEQQPQGPPVTRYYGTPLGIGQ